VVVAAYVTPAPIITLTSSNANQTLKAGSAITNIVYTIQHATGASVNGLPADLTGTYDNGTYTISVQLVQELLLINMILRLPPLLWVDMLVHL
jgi:hypothetical protein